MDKLKIILAREGLIILFLIVAGFTTAYQIESIDSRIRETDPFTIASVTFYHDIFISQEKQQLIAEQQKPWEILLGFCMAAYPLWLIFLFIVWATGTLRKPLPKEEHVKD